MREAFGLPKERQQTEKQHEALLRVRNAEADIRQTTTLPGHAIVRERPPSLFPFTQLGVIGALFLIVSLMMPLEGSQLLRTTLIAAQSGSRDVMGSIVRSPSRTLSQHVACSGTQVDPGEFDQSFVDQYPAGTTFCLRAGTHSLSAPIHARTGDSFIGEPGTILDGDGSTVPAVWGYGGPTGQKYVTIRGLVIQNFRPDGVDDGPDEHAVKTGWHWTVTDNEIRSNYVGIALYRSVARTNNIHHNDVYGLQGAAALAVNNEIAYNGGTEDSGGATGGTKIIRSTSTPFVFRRNSVHDNQGPGLWCDGFNRCIFMGNRVEDNIGPGIDHELSYRAVIRNNFLKDNGTRFVGDSIWVGGNIMIHNSHNVEIEGNTVIDSIGGNGIVVRHSNRGVDTFDIYVHDNMVKMADGGQSGFVTGEDNFDKLDQSRSGIRFANNDYYVKDRVSKWWRWGVDVSWRRWRAAGNDRTGRRALW